MSGGLLNLLLSEIEFLEYIGARSPFDVPTGIDQMPIISAKSGQTIPVSKKQVNWLTDTGEFRRAAVSGDLIEEWLLSDIEEFARKERSQFDVGQRADLEGYERRVLMFVSHDEGYSGARVWDHQIALGVAMSGHYVHVVASQQPKFLGEWPLPDRFDLEVRPSLSSGYTGYDVVIGSYPQGLKPAVEHARKLGAECWGICYEPDNWVMEHIPWLHNDRGRAAKEHLDLYLKCDRILCCSEMTAKKLLEWDDRFRSKKIHVIEPALNFGVLAESGAQPTLNRNRPLVSVVGRVKKYKGWEDSLAALRNVGRPLEVHVVGTGVKKAADWRDKMRNAGHELHLHESMPEGDKWHLIGRSTALVIASQHEGFAMVPAEAMAMGKPVIAWELDQLRAQWGEWIYFADHGDVDSLTAAVEHVVSGKDPSPDKRARMRDAVQSLTLDRVAEDVRLILEGDSGRVSGVCTQDCVDLPYTPGKVSIVTLQTDKHELTRSLWGSLVSKDPGRPIDWELVIVDNASKKPETEAWLKSVEENPEVQVVRLPVNMGFNKGNNEGSKVCTGEYIVLLNNDIEVFDGWLAPLVDSLEGGAGVAAPLVLDDRSRIHWCGSDWSTEMGAPQHALMGAPCDAAPSHPFETVTASGCAMAMHRSDWFSLGGFDPTYGPFYFEDVDYCLRTAAQIGKPIVCNPTATVLHRVHGTIRTEDLHRNYALNKILFQSRWAANVNPRPHRPKVVAGMIAYQCEEWIDASIRSIYDFCDEIVVVEGSVATTREWSAEGGGSSDSTIEVVESVPDPAGKIKIVRGAWPTKREMRNAYLEASGISEGDWLFQVDADEVFTHEDLEKIDQNIRGRAEVVLFHHLDYWQSLDRVCVGDAWKRFLQVRLHKYRAGDRYESHRIPSGVDGRSVQVDRKVVKMTDVVIHHFGYVFPDQKIERKIKYYQRDPATRDRLVDDWYKRVWLGWRENPELVEREVGIHPYGGGRTRMYRGPLPVPVITKYLDRKGEEALPWKR